MICLLYEFCARLHKANVVPNDRIIELYLMSVQRLDLKDEFIKFCFYNWENKFDALEKIINKR